MNRIDFGQLRAEMVASQIERRGVRDRALLDAMRAVPRERFVPEALRELACGDRALPIAEDQTISQPYIVALMIEALALEAGARVLEVGTGSGYSAAVLARLAAQVYTVERIEPLARAAAALHAELGLANVHGRLADGTLGWPEHAPYDAIVVSAAGPAVPESLKEQLRIGGRLVMPVGPARGFQKLVLVTRLALDRYRTDALADVSFVPLLGAEGFAP